MNVVFDLDGTLADIEHRKHHILGENKNWEQFYLDCDGDTDIYPVRRIFEEMYHAPPVCVEVWSGRSEGENGIVRAKTLAWFKERIGPNIYIHTTGKFFDCEHTQMALRMRPHENYMPDYELKKKWLMESRSQGQDVNLVFEDRQQVVDMWREEGVTCLQLIRNNWANDH